MFPSASACDGDEVLRQALAELRHRLTAGEPCRAETLLDAYPTLASNPRRALDLVIAEFLVRQDLGQEPDPEEWYSRFPQWQEALRSQFDLLQQRDGGSDLDTEEAPTKTDGNAPARSHPVASTPSLTPHDLLEEIEKGGMGVVYKARDLVLDRVVALKMIRTEGQEGTDSVARFYREARAAASLRHPNILPIHGMGLHAGAHCFTMPLIGGGSLAQRLSEYRNDPRKAVGLVEKVARAVHAAHQAGIIHRDLKPGNILLDDNGEPLVSDFGLAKLGGGSAEMTVPGQMLGTPAYMSPEQAAGRNDRVSAASDVWALGVVLYELLVGRRPFPGKSRDEVVPLILEVDPPRPRSLRPEVPGDLETILLKCLEKKPEHRYPSAAALADDLQAWLSGRPIGSRPWTWRRRLGRWARRHPWRSLAVVLLVALPTVFLFLPDRIDPDRPIKDQQRRLARGESVALIGATGGPVQIRWAAAKDRAVHTLAPDGTFAIQTWSLAMLELLPSQPLPRFRFRAEVRHDGNAEGHGYVGLYTLYSRAKTPRGEEVFDCDWTFNDVPGTAPRNLCFNLRRYWEGDDKSKGSKNSTLQLHDEPLRPRGKDDPGRTWHRLAVVVSADKLSAFYDGRLVTRKERSRVPQHVRYLFNFKPLPPDLPPLFQPEGGLGLFVFRASASFRNVILEPLSEQEANAGAGGP